MSMPFLSSVFDMLISHDLSVAGGRDILRDAIAPSVSMDSPMGLSEWLTSRFEAVLSAVRASPSGRADAEAYLFHIFYLASERDYLALDALRLQAA